MTLRVAVVHERFTEYAGSERVVEELVRLWPQADVLVPVSDPDALPPHIRADQVRTSRLQALYRGGGRYAHLLPLLPLAMARFDLRGYDLVVASHHAFANRVRPPSGVPLLSYVHSPARWVWEPTMRAGEAGPGGAAALALFAASQRRADRQAAERVGLLLANSHAVAERIDRWWRRPAQVVCPPVDVSYYSPDPAVPREPFFLLAGRLVPYKRPEVAAAAAAAAGVDLVVAGTGRSAEQVRAAGGQYVRMLGRVSDEELRDLYRRCRALVLPGEEDFGIVPVEAQACGAPVLALRAGGALDTVLPGRTGVLYDEPPGSDPVAVLAEQLRTFPVDGFDPAEVRQHAETFSPARFRAQVSAAADELLGRATSDASRRP
ncbi:MAG: hypothetical protein JWM64_1128 [Frankiales bacterium]|nr:hypothetical protein [Frankiales bacterium]